MKNVKANSNGNRKISLALLSLAAAGLAGCGDGSLGSGSTTGQTVPLVKTFSGNVHGGQQPVTGASVQLYTVGTGGLQTSATGLLTSAATTDGNGNFSITGLYNCSSATQVYLVATGGNSGAGVNSAIALVAPLGSCATLLANAATTYIQVNELTTVAAAYALAPFALNLTHVGANGVNPSGLVNAIANFNNLVNLATGLPGGSALLPTGAVVPTNELNTLGDILAACVNTGSSSSSPCGTLFTATGATDTFGAALAIAKNPGSSALTALFSLVNASAPFQPTYSAAPSDWTLAIKYNAGSTLATPYGVAIDAAGNAWITNASGSTVTELSANGNLLNSLTGGGLIGPKGIAIDKTGNIWVTNPGANSIVEFSSSGVVQSNAGFTGGGLNGPVSIAMDSAGNAWIANLVGNTVTELGANGSPTSANGSTGFTGSNTINGPSGIALDASGNVLVANSGGGNVVKLTHAGVVFSGSPFTDTALQGTTAVAVDSSSNVWAAGSTTGAALAGAVSQFSSAGAAASYSPLANGGLSLPAGAAAAGTSVWLSNYQTAGSLSQVKLSASAPVSPSAGFGSLNAPIGVAVDGSGNVWTANSGDNTVSVFVGLTTPVATPLAATVGP